MAPIPFPTAASGKVPVRLESFWTWIDPAAVPHDMSMHDDGSYIAFLGSLRWPPCSDFHRIWTLTSGDGDSWKVPSQNRSSVELRKPVMAEAVAQCRIAVVQDPGPAWGRLVEAWRIDHLCNGLPVAWFARNFFCGIYRRCVLNAVLACYTETLQIGCHDVQLCHGYPGILSSNLKCRRRLLDSLRATRIRPRHLAARVTPF
ncbi:hypothetical protein BV25DRAFT_1581654 [Artomyces pyxidatus]|uniref:Uncharacterized protein n=1 Tax=Artomyces pyxidatus TaxID=48021 RepID=A0ACB8TBW6_9AGAM|nr:hypothetical protein BV25DRAFT_1581654 [Artomyces pyxidatus]